MSANFTGGKLQNRLSIRRAGSSGKAALKQKKFFAERRLSKSLHTLTGLQQDQQRAEGSAIPTSRAMEAKRRQETGARGRANGGGVSLGNEGMIVNDELPGSRKRRKVSLEVRASSVLSVERDEARGSDGASRKKQRKSEILHLLDNDPILSFDQKRRQLLLLDDWAGLSAFPPAASSRLAIQSGSAFGYGPKRSPSSLVPEHRSSAPSSTSAYRQEVTPSRSEFASHSYSNHHPEEPLPPRSASPYDPMFLTHPSFHHQSSSPRHSSPPSSPRSHTSVRLNQRSVDKAPVSPRRTNFPQSHPQHPIRPLPERRSAAQELPSSRTTTLPSRPSASSSSAQAPQLPRLPLSTHNSNRSSLRSSSTTSSTSRSRLHDLSSNVSARRDAAKPRLFSKPSAFLSAPNAFLRPDLPRHSAPETHQPVNASTTPPFSPRTLKPKPLSPPVHHRTQSLQPLHLLQPSPAEPQLRAASAHTPVSFSDFPVSRHGALPKPVTFRDKEERYEAYQLPSSDSSDRTEATLGEGGLFQERGRAERRGESVGRNNDESGGQGAGILLTGAAAEDTPPIKVTSTEGQKSDPASLPSLVKTSSCKRSPSRPSPSVVPSSEHLSAEGNNKSLPKAPLRIPPSSSSSTAGSISTRSRISSTYFSQSLFPPAHQKTSPYEDPPSNVSSADHPLLPNPFYLTALHHGLHFPPPPHIAPSPPPSPIFISNPLSSHDTGELGLGLGGGWEGQRAGEWFWEKWGRGMAKEGKEWLEKRGRERKVENDRLTWEAERDRDGGNEPGGMGNEDGEERGPVALQARGLTEGIKGGLEQEGDYLRDVKTFEDFFGL